MAEQRPLLSHPWTPILSSLMMAVFSFSFFFFPSFTPESARVYNMLHFKPVLHGASWTHFKIRTSFDWRRMMPSTPFEKKSILKSISKRFIFQIKWVSPENSGIQHPSPPLPEKKAGIIFNLNTIIYTVLVTFGDYYCMQWQQRKPQPACEGKMPRKQSKSKRKENFS